MHERKKMNFDTDYQDSDFCNESSDFCNKNKVGRPKKLDEERKNYTLGAKFNQKQADAIGDYCDKRGITQSQFLYELTVNKLRRSGYKDIKL